MANSITLYIYHGGSFCGQPIDAYKGGEVKIANEVNLGQLSLVEIEKSLQELEYGNDFRYFYKYPDEGLEKLKILLNDQDIQKMIDNLGSCDTLELYVEHKIEKRREEEENKEEEEDFESEDDVDMSWMVESDDERIDEDLHNTEVDAIIRDEVKEYFSVWELPDEEDSNMEEKCWDSDNLEMIDGSDDEPTHKYPEFNEEVDMKENIKFEIGMKFSSIKAFKDSLVKNYAEDGRGFSYVKNDKERVRVLCAQKCGWSMHASWSNDRQSFQIKTFENEHKRGRHYENLKFTYKWVAHMYFEEIRDNPKWEPSKMVARIAREHGLVVTRSTCYRAKRKVIRSVEGDIAAQ
ncbi:hypothetical protein LUZ60_010505 [Juncus effusus]|nr:hypothetical protein LUZ60_010505 [Juncus effusus]